MAYVYRLIEQLGSLCDVAVNKLEGVLEVESNVLINFLYDIELCYYSFNFTFYDFCLTFNLFLNMFLNKYSGGSGGVDCGLVISPARSENLERSPVLSLLNGPVSSPGADVVESTATRIRALYTNATSLNSRKLAEVELMCYELAIEIVMVTETWFSFSSSTNLPNFQLFRRDRTGRRGGGVAIYVKDSLIASEVSDSLLKGVLLSESAEQVWCEVARGGVGDKLLLGCIYRPPGKGSSDGEGSRSELGAIIRSLAAASKAIEQGRYSALCVGGDFNFPELKWFDESVMNMGNDLNLSSIFLDSLESCCLYQAVRAPTFVPADGIPVNTLDFIIADSALRVDVADTLPPLGAASQGHMVLDFTINLPPTCRVDGALRLPRLNYSKGNYIAMRKHFGEVDWERVLCSSSVDALYNVFGEIYSKVVGVSVPLLSATRRYLPCWMTQQVAKLQNKKKRLWHDCRRAGWRSVPLTRIYSRVSRTLASRTRSAIVSHERAIAFSKCPKRLHAYTRSKLRVDTSISSIMGPDGQVLCSTGEIANVLNRHFASVFVSEPSLHAGVFPSPAAFSPSLDHVVFRVEDIAAKLATLDVSKAYGTDGVHPRVLKECSDAIAVPLAIIFKGSLNSGTLPHIWKTANVSPIFKKKGSRADPNNYRPISLTSVVCKVMETFVRDAIMNHLELGNLIAPEQHGFVPRKACVTNLLESMDVITSELNRGSVVDIIFLDFAKAFDRVPHERLLLKLKLSGIGGTLLTWLNDFLRGREQRVVLGGSCSDYVPVGSGVPQGSVLGPTLFAAYINDLPRVIINTSKLYADDCKIIGRADISGCSSIQSDLDAVAVWCETWAMKLNAEKCRVMHFGRQNPRRQYSLCGSILAQTSHERDLGIIISPDLKFSEQSAAAASRANAVLATLKRCFISRDVEMWTTLYKTYVRPHLEFAVQAWRPFLRRDCAVLERVQRRATRIPLPLRGKSYEERLNRMGLMQLEQRRTRGDVIQFFKLMRGADKVRWHSGLLWAPTREIKRPQLRREIVRACLPRYHFFTNRIASSWNSLPDDVVKSSNVNELKAKFDAFSEKRN